MPNIEIQPFNVQSNSWSEFYNNVECAVHQNSSLSDIQKNTYLKSLLRGSVLSIISGFKLSNENYNAALLKLLKGYFNSNSKLKSIWKIYLKFWQFLI